MTKEHKGRSIEEMRERWSKRQAEVLRSGEEKSVLIVRDTKEYERRLALPSLTGERGNNDVRYDLIGNMYVSSWRHKKTFLDDEGKKHLHNPNKVGYRVLSPSRTRETDLDNLPLSKDVSELILSKVGDVESAIRQQQHVLGFYKFDEEGEIDFALRVIGFVDGLANKYLSGEVGEDRLKELAKETGVFLEKLGLINPRRPEKRKILDLLPKINTKDSFGRINPLVARTRARAAYIKATRMLVIGGFVVEKSNSNLQVFSYEREITRWALRTAYDQLSFVSRHSYLLSGFGGTELQKKRLTDVMNTISAGHLATPRLNPYLKIARYSQISLIGWKDANWDYDRELFPDGVADILYTRIPVTSLIKLGEHGHARKRLEDVLVGIKMVLDKNEKIEKETRL